MPLYDYQCANCQKSCEILEKVNATPTVTCPACGKDQLQRQVCAPHFQLKGAGWYETDFKTKNKSADADKTTHSDKPETTTPPSTKTETDS